MWTFRCYNNSHGEDEINEWYNAQGYNVQAEMDAVIEYLGERPRAEWVRPKFAPLSGNCKGLYEIRFKVNNIQYRILGFFGPKRLVFNMVYVFKKKSDEYKRHCKKAQSRKKEIEEDDSKAKGCFFP